MNEVRVTFQPSGQSVYVLPGTSLLEAAGRDQQLEKAVEVLLEVTGTGD